VVLRGYLLSIKLLPRCLRRKENGQWRLQQGHEAARSSVVSMNVCAHLMQGSVSQPHGMRWEVGKSLIQMGHSKLMFVLAYSVKTVSGSVENMGINFIIYDIRGM
jgi:hypothetical protein